MTGFYLTPRVGMRFKENRILTDKNERSIMRTQRRLSWMFFHARMRSMRR